jgi:hypothetical protein
MIEIADQAKLDGFLHKRDRLERFLRRKQSQYWPGMATAVSIGPCACCGGVTYGCGNNFFCYGEVTAGSPTITGLVYSDASPAPTGWASPGVGVTVFSSPIWGGTVVSATETSVTLSVNAPAGTSGDNVELGAEYIPLTIPSVLFLTMSGFVQDCIDCVLPTSSVTLSYYNSYLGSDGGTYNVWSSAFSQCQDPQTSFYFCTCFFFVCVSYQPPFQSNSFFYLSNNINAQFTPCTSGQVLCTVLQAGTPTEGSNTLNTGDEPTQFSTSPFLVAWEYVNFGCASMDVTLTS